MKPDTELRRELQARLDVAQEELRKNEAENARLKRLAQGLRNVLASINHDGSQPSTQGLLMVETGATAIPAGQISLSDMSIREAAETLLRKQPMSSRELFDAFERGGKKLGGKSPIGTLRATLRSYKKVFTRTEDGKWTVIDGSVVGQFGASSSPACTQNPR